MDHSNTVIGFLLLCGLWKKLSVKINVCCALYRRSKGRVEKHCKQRTFVIPFRRSRPTTDSSGSN
jgi:hypothetical protein